LDMSTNAKVSAFSRQLTYPHSRQY